MNGSVQEPDKFPQSETSIGNNSGSIEDRAVSFAYNIGVFGYGGSNGVAAVFVT